MPLLAPRWDMGLGHGIGTWTWSGGSARRRGACAAPRTKHAPDEANGDGAYLCQSLREALGGTRSRAAMRDNVPRPLAELRTAVLGHHRCPAPRHCSFAMPIVKLPSGVYKSNPPENPAQRKHATLTPGVDGLDDFSVRLLRNLPAKGECEGSGRCATGWLI